MEEIELILVLHIFNFVSVQLFILEEGLINHPVVGFGESGRKATDLRILLAKIEESEVCDLVNKNFSHACLS